MPLTEEQLEQIIRRSVDEVFDRINHRTRELEENQARLERRLQECEAALGLDRPDSGLDHDRDIRSEVL